MWWTASNQSNLILPAGDVRIGTKDYNLYANSQVPTAQQINSMPLKSSGNASVLVADVGHAEDSGALQTNIVRIDGQHSVYVPILKQAGKSNTISIVNGMRAAIKRLVDIPPSLKTAVVFDQSVFVKGAIKNLLKEALIGLVLTGLMILLFLGSPRAAGASLLSIPMAILLCLLVMNAFGGTINTMLLGGIALVLSRLIDNSVVVLENIIRFMEEGAPPDGLPTKAARKYRSPFSPPPSPPPSSSSPSSCSTASAAISSPISRSASSSASSPPTSSP